MRWTNWRKIAEGNWFDDSCLDHDGPAVYQLATGGPRGGQLRVRYVGETSSESRRIREYARFGSHISHHIDEALRGNWSLYYRASARRSKAEAKASQDNLLAQGEHDYDWNSYG